MSKRLTKKWTDTLPEAFGDEGTKGEAGEKFLCEVFDNWGWEYEWHQNDKNLQVRGIDITFKKPSWHNSYTCDVKANMNEYGAFFVHEDWLYKGESDRIFHVNAETGWFCWYDRAQMQDYYQKEKEFITIIPSKRPNWIKAAKYENSTS